MIFNVYEKSDLPVVVMLHGGGLSDWSLSKVADLLKDNVQVITPILDGHGEDGESTFISIEDCADKLIANIDKHFGGSVELLTGLSIGAQVVIEALMRRPALAKKAVIESGLILPMKSVAQLVPSSMKMSYPLIKQRWFAKLQAKSLFIEQDMFERYYQDSMQMSLESLINMSISNALYDPQHLQNITAQTLILVGEKEISAMKKSAEKLNKEILSSRLVIVQSMGHGQVSLQNPKQYLELVKQYL
jgi:pimeloyl-ACP methyl ester carboxylesterase